MSAYFIPPNEDQKRNIFKSCRIQNEQQLKNDAKILREWLRQQPHLPHDVCDNTLETILVQKKNSMEEAKKQIERFFSERAMIPEFFDNQDPQSEEIQMGFDVVHVGICSKMTEKGERVTLAKLADPKNEFFNPSSILKRTLMIADLRIKFETIEGGEILLYDFEGAGLAHMSQCTPKIGKQMLDVLKIMPMRFKCAIFINAPSGLETLVYIVKQFLPDKLQKRIFVYAGDYTNLYKHVPKELLPKDYGGEDMTLKELSEAWRTELLNNREWFLDQSNRRSDESKRPKNSTFNPKDRFSTQGSFKTLSVD